MGVGGRTGKRFHRRNRRKGMETKYTKICLLQFPEELLYTSAFFYLWHFDGNNYTTVITAFYLQKKPGPKHREAGTGNGKVTSPRFTLPVPGLRSSLAFNF